MGDKEDFAGRPPRYAAPGERVGISRYSQLSASVETQHFRASARTCNSKRGIDDDLRNVAPRN